VQSVSSSYYYSEFCLFGAAAWHFGANPVVIACELHSAPSSKGSSHAPFLALRRAVQRPYLSASALAVDIDAASYGYPLTNPFEATIATTPPDLRPELPLDDDINQSDRSVTLRPEREFILPDNFWAVKKLTYRIATQDKPAPLIFLIAGTGARYDSTLNEYLKKLYYKAGYHVVQLSSPTSFDFISAASRFATPGVTKEDAEDMYRVMQAVRAQNPNCRSPSIT
jgi:hypothetical protein